VATTLTEHKVTPTTMIRPRLDSVDMLRGVVMVLMVLDHTRDFFYEAKFDPTDPTQTTVALFFTRWVTHFCAPLFVFLAGSGAYLAGARGKSKPELAWFLLTRGLWLVVLELTVVRVALTFNPRSPVLLATTLWAIGWSMVGLSALVFLPLPVIAAFGIVTMAAHNLLDGVNPESLGRWRAAWIVLHQPGQVQLPGGWILFVAYPLVPWVGVIAAGYAFGRLLLLEPARRRRVLLTLGLALTLAFVALRASNLYGDPRPWTAQKSDLFTALSFLNCLKYPFSLLFLLMTLGPGIAALALLDRPTGKLTRPILIFGRVPLFFYLLQWPVLHVLAIAMALANGRKVDWLFKSFFPGTPPGYGFGLPTVYLMWLVVLVLLYPACRWFAGVKQRRRDAWLSYL